MTGEEETEKQRRAITIGFLREVAQQRADIGPLLDAVAIVLEGVQPPE